MPHNAITPPPGRMRHGLAVAAKLRALASPATTYDKGKQLKSMTPQERALAAAELHEKAARTL